MSLIKKWFKRPIKLEGREVFIFGILELMLTKSDTEVRIDPENMDYYIHNKEMSYDMIVTSIGIIFTNSVFTIREDHRSDFLDHCKSTAKKRATADRQKIKAGILARETNMLKKLLKT